MKTIFINSYYSEIDYSDVNYSGVDGVYKVVYDDFKFAEWELKKAITYEYERMQDNENGELVHNLGEVLEVLYKKETIISWEKVKTIKFDCDYGEFDD